QIGLQRQGPLARAAQVLGPVQGEDVVGIAEGVQVCRIVQHAVGKKSPGNIEVLPEGAALELAGECSERNPGTGAEGVVQLAGELIGGPPRPGYPDAAAVDAIVA